MSKKVKAQSLVALGSIGITLVALALGVLVQTLNTSFDIRQQAVDETSQVVVTVDGSDTCTTCAGFAGIDCATGYTCVLPQSGRTDPIPDQSGYCIPDEQVHEVTDVEAYCQQPGGGMVCDQDYDFNDDGRVNLQDYNLFLTALLESLEQ